jgi:hypothetical protein
MIEVPGNVDQVDQVSNILFRVWRFDEVAIHETSKDPFTHRRPAHGSKRSGPAHLCNILVTAPGPRGCALGGASCAVLRGPQ